MTAGAVLRRAITGQRRLVIGAALLYMLWQACESLVPVVIGQVIQRAISTSRAHAILGWIIALAALFLVLSLAYRFASRASARATEQAALDVRIRLADHLLDPRSLPVRNRHAGVTVSIASSDADWVGALCGVAPRACGALVSVLFAAAVLLRISIPLGLLVLLGCPALLVAIHFLGGPLERRSTAEQARAGEAAALATDLLTGLRVLKGIRAEGAAAARYAVASRSSLRATLRAARSEAGYEAATMLLTLGFLAVVALVSGRFAAEGRITIGDLVAAVGLAQFLLGPLSSLSDTGATLARIRASARRVAGVLATPVRSESAATGPAPLTGELDVAASLSVAAGELVAVVAEPTAAAALIDTLADAAYTDADVRVGGVRVGELDSDSARRVLLVARHDAHLFADSVRANVAAGGPHVDEAVLAADVDEVGASLPGGLATVLGERGSTLSGGQRQRVALARALASEATVLVLHDPTTAVDVATEARIADGLQRLRRGRTTLIVTTSPTLLAACDRVLLLEDGVVRATGTHAELSDDARYRELVR